MTTLYKVCVEHSQENCKKLYNFLKSVGCTRYVTDTTDIENTTLYDYAYTNWEVEDNYCIVLVKDNLKCIYYGFIDNALVRNDATRTEKTCNVDDFINSFKRRVEL